MNGGGGATGAGGVNVGGVNAGGGAVGKPAVGPPLRRNSSAPSRPPRVANTIETTVQMTPPTTSITAGLRFSSASRASGGTSRPPSLIARWKSAMSNGVLENRSIPRIAQAIQTNVPARPESSPTMRAFADA